MKNTKNSMSKTHTNKATKPTYIVNLIGATGEQDATLRFALCKYENNIDNFTTSDICAIKNYIEYLSMTYSLAKMISAQKVYIVGCGVVFATEPLENVRIEKCLVRLKTSKPNIFKRFWNWITCKK